MPSPHDGEVDLESSVLVDALVEEEDPERRARLLLRHAAQRAQAAGLLAEDGAHGWQALVTRGEAGLLPGSELVEAVAAGQLQASPTPGQVVLVTGVAPRRWALVLAGARYEEDELDRLEVLALLLSTLDAAGGEGDGPFAPFPT